MTVWFNGHAFEDGRCRFCGRRRSRTTSAKRCDASPPESPAPDYKRVVVVPKAELDRVRRSPRLQAAEESLDIAHARAELAEEALAAAERAREEAERERDQEGLTAKLTADLLKAAESENTELREALQSLVTVAAKVMDGWWEFADPETGAGAEAVTEWFDSLESQVRRARAALARESSPTETGE